MKEYFNKVCFLKSLKVRLIMFLICSCIIPILLMGGVTLYHGYDLYRDNMELLIQNELNQIKDNMEYIMESMINMSQQLVYDGQIGKELYLYLDETEGIEKVNMLKYLNKQIATYELANPNIANITYFYKDISNQLKKINLSLAKEQFPKDEEQLYQKNEIIFYGPHQTASVASKYEVISLVRKIKIPGYEDIWIYMESGYKQMQYLLTEILDELSAIYLIKSDQGKIIYTNNEEVVEECINSNRYVKMGNEIYISYDLMAEGGWGISILIPEVNYTKQINALAFNYCIIIIVSVGISMALAYIIWKSIYKPFQQFDKNLKQITSGQVKEQLEVIHIEELDQNFAYFDRMRKNILELVRRVEEEGNEKAKLEIKQLFYKINPHFIHNTLLSLKWYADEKGDRDIVDFITALNKLLIYNMEKDKETSLEKELEAIKDYIIVQKIKYEIDFKLEVNIPRMMLSAEIPRFILQPLVENAIFYGIEGCGNIKITVDMLSNGKISIKVINNGTPIDEAKLNHIIKSTKDSSENGIGLQYVIRIIENKFGSEAEFNVSYIRPNENQIEIVIPYSRGGLYVKNSCSGR